MKYHVCTVFPQNTLSNLHINNVLKFLNLVRCTTFCCQWLRFSWIVSFGNSEETFFNMIKFNNTKRLLFVPPSVHPALVTPIFHLFVHFHIIFGFILSTWPLHMLRPQLCARWPLVYIGNTYISQNKIV